MGKLDGKVALVTGAAVGMGREIAIALGREGAKVVVNYSRSKDEADETAKLVHATGGEAVALQADVSNDAEVRAMVEETVKRFGRIDVLVNNAGVTAHVPFENLEGLDDEAFDRLYAVNVKGPFFTTRAVAPHMKRQGEGRIINLGSVAGQRPFGSSIAYSASKAALMHLSRCMAKTLGPEIRINCVVPGQIVDTRWNEGRPGYDPEAAAKSGAQAVPLKRVGVSEDVAEVVLFLATGADFLTGVEINVDGGRELTI